MIDVDDRLELRRRLRRLLLEHAQDRQLGIGALFLLGGAGLALHSAIIPDGIGGVLLFALLVGIVAVQQSHLDQCPRCEGQVDVFAELRCARCGELLEDLPHLPPEYHEALAELEAELQAREERTPVEVADGVEVVA